MNRKKLKRLIGAFLLGLTLLSFKPILASASSVIDSFKLSKDAITYNINNSKANILLYSSHSQERYKDDVYSVIDVQKDLKEKLEKKGYNVTITTNDFSGINGYNFSYSESNKYLKTLDLDGYDLIIDIHRDAYASYNKAVEIDGKSVSKCRFVYSEANVDDSRAILGKELLEQAEGYGIVGEPVSYNSGIFGKNQIYDNSFLIEVGNEKDDLWAVKRATTYITNSIDNYFKNMK